MKQTGVSQSRSVYKLAFDALCEKMEQHPDLLDCLDYRSQVSASLTPIRRLRPDTDAPPSWTNLQSSDFRVRAKVAANCTDVALAVACAPALSDEVGRTAARIAVAMGITRSRALSYCDIGTMLERMPAVCCAVSGGAFSFDLLRILADATMAVNDVTVGAIDTEIAALLTPVRPQQCLPGPRVLRRETARIVERHQPDAVAPDPDAAEIPPPSAQSTFQVDSSGSESTTLHITLPTDEATAVIRIIDAVASAHRLSRARAFSELCHGTVGNVSVTLNCYRNLDCGEMHFENQWLSAVATNRWMKRVTHLAVPSHNSHDGRFATEPQKALRAGIDGTCRGPGCDRDAATAQTDHIHRFGDLSSATTRRTATWKVQQLCPRCHNAKTRGLVDYTAFPDGTTEVTSTDDGHSVVTVPTGPLARAILTFDKRLQRRVAARKEHNAALTAWRQRTRETMDEVPF